MNNKEITITMEEYKELLIIKGKYEELKSQNQGKLKYIGRKYNKQDKIPSIPIVPYKITCKED